MAMLCPITSTNRNFPFHVPFKENSIQGVVITEQMKSLDVYAREISFIEKIDKNTLKDVMHLLQLVLP